MTEQSLYDRIHDQFLPNTIGKPGTRYERLAAVVFAGLKAAGSVIHDLKLRGGVSGELHQIDVTVETSGLSRRILIECKDFDLSGRAVGLSTVRDFYGVVADLNPDESWIVSCNGFTRPARAYAKGFGIKLAVLREFREADWEGRVRTILVRLEVKSAYNINVVGLDSPDKEGLQALLRSASEAITGSESDERSVDPSALPIAVERDRGEPQGLQDFLEGDTKKQLPTQGLADGVHTFRVAYDHLAFECNGMRAPVAGLTISYSLSTSTRDIKVEAPGIAILLLKGPEGDVILWDRDLRSYTINEEGRVLSSSDITTL
jgi:Restriction endonuclease